MWNIFYLPLQNCERRDAYMINEILSAVLAHQYLTRLRHSVFYFVWLNITHWIPSLLIVPVILLIHHVSVLRLVIRLHIDYFFIVRRGIIPHPGCSCPLYSCSYFRSCLLTLLSSHDISLSPNPLTSMTFVYLLTGMFYQIIKFEII